MATIFRYTVNFFLLFLCYFLGGCKKFVTIDTPISQLVTGSVFNNAASATAALTSIYSQMQIDSYDMSHNTGLLGDELDNYTSGNIPFFTNNLTAVQSPGPWTKAYSYIYQANAVIEGLQKFEGVDQIIKDQLIGEAKFIRAFWHFYLVNCYGDVPLVTSTDYAVNAIKHRDKKDGIYKQIVSDLEDAQKVLNANYVDGSDSVVIMDRIRPNKFAATAFLARVYLYSGDFENAANSATTVIGNAGLYKLEEDLNDVFKINSRETIWQLGLPSTRFNTYDAEGYVLTGTPTDVAISDRLLNVFEPGDKRKSIWIGDTTTADGTFYYPNKYKVRAVSTAEPAEEVMMLRLSEQFLIRAEARTILGDVTGAVSDLDTVRIRVGLASYTGSTDKSSLLTAILHERQVELFTEWGHRWFDMIRTGAINSIMSGSTGVSHAKGGSWNNNGQQTLFPIPQSELMRDPNLIQNTGY